MFMFSTKEARLFRLLEKNMITFLLYPLMKKKEVRDFYNARIRQLDGAQRLICRESSIQVVLQLTLILYQANYQEKYKKEISYLKYPKSEDKLLNISNLKTTSRALFFCIVNNITIRRFREYQRFVSQEQ